MLGWAAAAVAWGGWGVGEVLWGVGVRRAVRAARAAGGGGAGEGSEVPEVTVVVCVRNGESQVETWAEAVRACRGVAFEVVAVDDGSSDGTPERLAAAADRWEPGRFRTVRVEGTGPGKREALAAGVAAARGAIVVATDIDCRPLEPGWVEALSRPLRMGRADVVAGVSLPVGKGAPRSGVEWMQLADDLRVARSYVAAAGWGRPYMAVGRNWAFRRDLVLEVVAKAPPGVASGDDDLTLQAWLRAWPGLRVVADPRPEAATVTAPARSLAAWSRRKRRHYSTAPHYPVPVLLRLAWRPALFVAGAVGAGVEVAQAGEVVHTALGIVAGAAAAMWVVQAVTLHAFARTAGLNGRAAWAGLVWPAVAAGRAIPGASAAWTAGRRRSRTPTEPLNMSRQSPADDPWT